MKNINQLRESLASNYDKMQNNQMSLETGRQLANTAGKILSSLKVELEYNNMMKNKKRIKFLEY